jgi:Uma2 family endonuclease
MATDAQEIADQSSEPDEDSDPSMDWYDRSSLKGDFMVMIADQTVEDYRRRAPANRFCEFIDGMVYLHSHASNMPEPSPDPDDPTRVWYDRSSLVGDFMVMIPDQTEEDYLRRCPENQFCEYIDGVVYMPSPVDAWHQFEIQFLIILVEMFAQERQAGIVLTGPTSLKVRPNRYLEPDLFVLPAGGEVQIHGFYSDPPVLLVVEILSRSTRSNDLKRKVELYREVGAVEIWFVDLRDQIVFVHVRTEQGYEVREVRMENLHSRALPGFWIDASWLWSRPRPNFRQCLEAILAGPPA